MAVRRLTIPVVILAVLPAALLASLLSWAAPCGIHDDGTMSPCFMTSRFLLVLAAALFLLGLVRATRLPLSRRALAADTMFMAGGAAIALLPGNFLPLCMMETMRCHTLMRPAALIFGIAIAVVGLIDYVLIHRERE